MAVTATVERTEIGDGSSRFAYSLQHEKTPEAIHPGRERDLQSYPLGAHGRTVGRITHGDLPDRSPLTY
jgi:hypothetical protein